VIKFPGSDNGSDKEKNLPGNRVKTRNDFQSALPASIFNDRMEQEDLVTKEQARLDKIEMMLLIRLSMPSYPPNNQQLNL
jgi:hypothetical protein